MACCAFAILLLSQLLLPFRWVRERLFGPAVARVDAGVDWSPQGATLDPVQASTVPRVAAAFRLRPFGQRTFGVMTAALLVEVVVLAGAFGAARPWAEPATLSAAALLEVAHQSICR